MSPEPLQGRNQHQHFMSFMDKQSGISPRFNIKANQRLGIGGAEVKTPVCEGQAQAVAVVAFACDRGIVRGDVVRSAAGSLTVRLISPDTG